MFCVTSPVAFLTNVRVPEPEANGPSFVIKKPFSQIKDGVKETIVSASS